MCRRASRSCSSYVESGEGIESTYSHTALQMPVGSVESGEGIESLKLTVLEDEIEIVVESGEGIESLFNYVPPHELHILWNPVKELKVYIFCGTHPAEERQRHHRVESGEGIERFLHHRAGFLRMQVESGEGIESF